MSEITQKELFVPMSCNIENRFKKLLDLYKEEAAERIVNDECDLCRVENLYLIQIIGMGPAVLYFILQEMEIIKDSEIIGEFYYFFDLKRAISYICGEDIKVPEKFKDFKDPKEFTDEDLIKHCEEDYEQCRLFVNGSNMVSYFISD